MATEWPQALRIIAFKEALSKTPSAEFSLRKLFRWYSVKYCTPLHVVETLPLFDILRHHYEDTAVAMVDSEDQEMQMKLQEELLNLCKSEAELAQEKLEKDKEEVSERKLLGDMEKHNKSGADAAKAKKRREIDAKIQRDRKVAEQVEKLLGKDALGSRVDIGAMPKNNAPEDFEPEPEDINMSFTGLDEIGDIDGLSSLTGLK